MDIIFLGHSSFKISGKTASVLTDPFDPNTVGLKFPKVSADIVTISHDHNDHNQVNLVSDVKRVIKGPGEYEIAGISIIGFSSFHDDKKGEVRGKNTIYIFEIDGLRIAHLGDLGHNLDDEMVSGIGDINILLIPVGGEYTIGPAIALGIVQNIEPDIVIPMHYQMEGLNPEVFSKLENLDGFLKEVGVTVERLDKLTVKKEELGETKKIVILAKK